MRGEEAVNAWDVRRAVSHPAPTAEPKDRNAATRAMIAAPALHNAASADLATLMADLRDLVIRTRAGRSRASELADATMTVSNLGDQGIELRDPGATMGRERTSRSAPNCGGEPVGRSSRHRWRHRRSISEDPGAIATDAGGAVKTERTTETLLGVLHEVAPDADLSALAADADLRESLELDSLDFLRAVELLSEQTGRDIREGDYPRLATFGSTG